MAISNNNVTYSLELLQVADDPRVVEAVLLKRRLIDDHLDALGLDALHHALNGRGAEVVRAGLHHQAIDAHHLRVALEDGLGDEVLAHGVRFDNRADQRAGYVRIVGQQLLGVLGQTVAAVTEAGVVVVHADARVEADSFDDLARIQPVGFGVGVQLVEVGHAHGQVGVGEQLDGFGFGAVSKQGGNVLLDGALLQQAGKGFRALGAFANDDARGMKVVVERSTLAQKLRREKNVTRVVFLADALGVTNRHCGLDHHDRVRIDRQDVLNNRFDAARIEKIGLRVVVGRGGDDDEVGIPVGFMLVQGGAQVEGLFGKELLDLPVFDRRLAVIDKINLGLDDVERDDRIVLRQKNGVGKAYVAGAGNGDIHWFLLRIWVR